MARKIADYAMIDARNGYGDEAMSNTIINADLLAREMVTLLCKKMETAEIKPANHIREVVITRTEMMGTLKDLSKEKLAAIADELIAECLQKPGRFYPPEMPDGAYGGQRIAFAGIYVRVLPIYDGEKDTSKFQIAVAYY